MNKLKYAAAIGLVIASSACSSSDTEVQAKAGRVFGDLKNSGVCKQDAPMPQIRFVTGGHSRFVPGTPPEIELGQSVPESVEVGVNAHEFAHYCGYGAHFEYSDSAYTYHNNVVVGEFGYSPYTIVNGEVTYITSLDEGYATVVGYEFSTDKEAYLDYAQRQGDGMGSYVREMNFYLYLCELANHEPLENIGFMKLLQRVFNKEEITGQEYSSFVSIMEKYSELEISKEEMVNNIEGLIGR